MTSELKLLNVSDICELLGISKTTLYRWNNLSEEQEYSNSRAGQLLKKINKIPHTVASLDDLPNKVFPRPFKIGRAYKWKESEVLKWLESQRA